MKARTKESITFILIVTVVIGVLVIIKPARAQQDKKTPEIAKAAEVVPKRVDFSASDAAKLALLSAQLREINGEVMVILKKYPTVGDAWQFVTDEQGNLIGVQEKPPAPQPKPDKGKQ